MNPQLNEQVQTPIGPGIVEHTWPLHGRRHVLVRIQITDANHQHLQDENCMTRQAQIFGLWIYDAMEVKTCMPNESTA
jgi:hypothetical protein